jgi:hypothetical protein
MMFDLSSRAPKTMAAIAAVMLLGGTATAIAAPVDAGHVAAAHTAPAPVPAHVITTTAAVD